MPRWFSNFAIIPGLDAATAAWEDAVVGNGGSVSSARETIVDALVKGLKSDGVWTKLDRLWLYGENQPSALTDVAARTLATAVLSPTFTPDNGFTFNDSTNYIDTNWRPSDGPNFTLNTGHIGAWIFAVGAGIDDGDAAFGQDDGATGNDTLGMFYQAATPNWLIVMNAGSGALTTAASTGHIMGVRSSTQTTPYVNGSVGTAVGPSVNSLGTRKIFVGANNSGGSGNRFSPNQISAFHVGGALTGTEATALYNRLRTYMSAVGIP